MRDLFLLAAIITFALLAMRKPQVGILAWLWLSIMNPHKLTYGFIYNMQVLDALVGITLLSCLFHWKEKASTQFHGLLKLLLAFYIWCTLTTIFSVDFFLSLQDWIAFTKTLLLVVCILLFMNKKHWILGCFAIFILSIGFTGFKGGIFTVLTGGGHKVWGPPGTAWGDNNGVSIAMLMVMPITLAYFHIVAKKWQKLTVVSVTLIFFSTLLGTQSRGGLIGMLGICGVVMLRSQKKLLMSVLVILTLSAGYAFMPQSWHERMSTIQHYQQDSSASTRLIQWGYAIDISLERPIFGNGFDAFFYKPYYLMYAADKDANRAVHSNYFQVLGEQGYIGLLMYLALIIMIIVKAKKYALKCKGRKDLIWAASLLSALQFSIVGYAVNGLTVNMAYLDLFYYLLAFCVLLICHIQGKLKFNESLSPSRKQTASNRLEQGAQPDSFVNYRR
jgi:probable O-glycosylation ligase (exosortase A-associated)